MKWINEYQLFLFDFDGLLVDTEAVHFAAYKKMCSERGLHLNWDFTQFCHFAHQDTHTLRSAIAREVPDLGKANIGWETLYKEKTQYYMDLLGMLDIKLMPGAKLLLKKLKKNNIKRCVVTNSTFAQINTIRKRNDILGTIPYWITREDYHMPKPNPECYQKAINQLAEAEDRIIGFEDSPKGLFSLMETRATPVLIRDSIPKVLQEEWQKKKFIHFQSLEELFSQNLRV